MFTKEECLLLGWRRYVPPKRRVPLNALHCVISQKKILFKTTAVKTSNPTFTKEAENSCSSILGRKQYLFSGCINWKLHALHT
jgi:hypothetical protein